MLALTGNLFSPTGQPTINACTDLALLTSGSGIMIYFDPISVSVQTIDVSANPDQRDGVYAACEKRSFFTDTGNNNLYKFT